MLLNVCVACANLSTISAAGICFASIHVPNLLGIYSAHQRVRVESTAAKVALFASGIIVFTTYLATLCLMAVLQPEVFAATCIVNFLLKRFEIVDRIYRIYNKLFDPNYTLFRNINPTHKDRDVVEQLVNSTVEARKKFWNSLEFPQKENFVARYSTGTDEQSAKIRRVFTDIVYQAATKGPLTNTPLAWRTDAEIEELSPKTPSLSPEERVTLISAKYFHATKTAIVAKILDTRKILVMHEQQYKGAFVSALKPEWQYGEVVFGFKRNIEYTSKYETSLRDDQGCWHGFASPISVTSDTLSCLIIKNISRYGIRKSPETIEHEKQKWRDLLTKKGFPDVPVICISRYESEALLSRPIGVPAEWV